MKIFDMHIHATNTQPDSKLLLNRMEAAGIWGGCVFSNPPVEQHDQEWSGSDFETRMRELNLWTRDSSNRLFPVLWIHPKEDGIFEKIETAAERGVVAFKMICADYFVYDDRCMQVLSKIASLDKPVIFHSGVLYDGLPSSQYNRPVNWEALLGIENIRFSMGHCSWPWYDECLALYGKLRHARRVGKKIHCFLDLTPGTPMAYREDLFRKMFSFVSEEDILFGTDCCAGDYDVAHAKKWLDFDGSLMDSLKIATPAREKIYNDNLFRFLNIPNPVGGHTQT